MPRHDDDVRLLGDWVRRLRRISQHPIALQDDGEFLRKLFTVETKAEVRSDGTATLRSPLPNEALFESLAVRVRASMLSKDRLYFVKALDALDRLTAHDQRAQKVNQQVRQGWIAATDRSTRTRAYRINVNAQRYTDVELAFAWLYQDVAHGDESTTGDLGIVERYRAAVGVFSHVAVMSLRTLDYLKQLDEHGVIQIPVEALNDDVIVTDTEVVIDGSFYEAPVGSELGGWESGGPLPDHFRPAFDAVHEIVQNTQADRPQTD